MTYTNPPSDDCSALKGLLAGYEDEVLLGAGLRGRVVEFQRNDQIIFAGQPRETAWVLRSGWVRVLLPSGEGESTAEILSPGDLFGCPGCSGKTYTCTAVALTDVHVVAYCAKNLERFLHANADAVCRLSAILGRRVREVAFLKGINGERSTRRVPRALSFLRVKFGDDMPVSRELLADICGLRRETCSRMLSALKRRGILSLAAGRIRILRPADLERGGR